MTDQTHGENDIRDRIAGFSLPPLATRIIEVTSNKRLPVQSLAELIAAEPLLAARLLTLGNFASGLTQAPPTISQAVAVLGVDTLRSLALGLTLVPFSPVSRDDETPERNTQAPLTLRHLWEHSMGCAVMAGRISAKIGHGGLHDAFVSGFLHDVGRVVLYTHAKEGLLEAFSLAADKSIPLREAETLALGIDHAALGEMWACKVDLPPILQHMIRYHHERVGLLPDFMDAEQQKTLGIVQLADLLCELHDIGRGGDRSSISEELWATLNPKDYDYREELCALKQELEVVRELFGFLKDDAPKARRVPEGRRERIVVDGTRGQVIPFPVRSVRNDRPTESRPTKKLTILVVEDHGALCEMLRLYLMRYGYHVRAAKDGERALEILSKEDIHLLLLDLMLPRMDGFTVLEWVREKKVRRVPYVIVLSAGASEKDRNKVLELGANEYMPKPFQLMRLLERIRAVEKYLL